MPITEESNLCVYCFKEKKIGEEKMRSHNNKLLKYVEITIDEVLDNTPGDVWDQPIGSDSMLSPREYWIHYRADKNRHGSRSVDKMIKVLEENPLKGLPLLETIKKGRNYQNNYQKIKFLRDLREIKRYYVRLACSSTEHYNSIVDHWY